MLRRTDVLPRKESQSPASTSSSSLRLRPGSTADPQVKARQHRQISALVALCQRHKGLPYSAPLPLRSHIPWTANRSLTQLGTAGKGSEQGGVPDERRRLRRSPVAPRAVQHPAESAQFSAPWTVSAALPPVGAGESCSPPPSPGQRPLGSSGLRSATCRDTVSIFNDRGAAGGRQHRHVMHNPTEGCREAR